MKDNIVNLSEERDKRRALDFSPKSWETVTEINFSDLLIAAAHTDNYPRVVLVPKEYFDEVSAVIKDHTEP